MKNPSIAIYILLVAFAISLPLRAASERRNYSSFELAGIESQLKRIDIKISVTQSEIKRIRDTDFLPDLYFSLADLQLQKARLMYIVKINREKSKHIVDIDFSVEKRPKLEAIDIYQKIYAFFPKSKFRDRALFYKALELRDIGQVDAMTKSIAQLNQEFPDSRYVLEGNIMLGDFYLDEKKEAEAALQSFRKVIAREMSPYTPLAHYRIGSCFLSLQKYQEAVAAFEEAVRTQGLVNAQLAAKTGSNPADELPELYRNIDIKREAVLSLAMPYVEIYTEYAASLSPAAQKTSTLPVKGEKPPLETEIKVDRPARVVVPLKAVILPVEYFRKITDSHLTYRQAMSRVGRRLALKEQWSGVADAWMEVLIASSEASAKFEAIERWSEAVKKAPMSTTDRFKLVEHAVATAQDIRARGLSPDGKLPKRDVERLKVLEIVTRDTATRLQQSARDRGAVDDFALVAKAYDLYQVGFPQTGKLPKMILNKAESLYRAEDWTHAGLEFESLARASKGTARESEFRESAIQAYVNALKDSEKLMPLGIVRARRGIQEIGSVWLPKHLRSPAAASTAYNIAQSWYEDRSLAQAIKSFTYFIKNFSRDRRIRDAIFMVINSYSQLDDLKGLVTAARSLENTRGLTAEDRQAIRDLSRRAELKDVQSVAGNFGSKEYADNLVNLASKYKDSSLGAVAMYEAFKTLKTRRDREFYDIGEALLEKHSDSTYTKEVVSQMAQAALLTTDFERAARYMGRYSEKYPKESESTEWRKNAAQIYEWLGDFKEARKLYAAMGDAEAVARCDYLAGDWPALERSSTKINPATGFYYYTLALWREGRQPEALPRLKQLASGRDVERSANARFLLAQRALESFRAIQMKDAADQGALLGKVKSFQELSKQLNDIVAVGVGRWTIASLYLLGQANFELAKFIAGSPLPGGLKPAEIAIYRKELGKRARQYGDAANDVFKQCFETAARFEVFTRYVSGCREKGQLIVREEVDTVVTAKQKKFSPPKYASIIRKKLYDAPRDTKLLLDLASQYVLDGQYWVAMSIYNRILEIEPANAPAMARIGLCRLYLNDLDSAGTLFKNALKISPGESVAVWNLSGLYREFGFQTQLKALAARRARVAKPKLLHPMAKKL